MSIHDRMYCRFEKKMFLRQFQASRFVFDFSSVGKEKYISSTSPFLATKACINCQIFNIICRCYGHYFLSCIQHPHTDGWSERAVYAPIWTLFSFPRLNRFNTTIVTRHLMFYHNQLYSCKSSNMCISGLRFLII